MNIELLLNSKIGNKHYIDRYIRFIKSIDENKNVIYERHHILPKSKDLFPEYGDTKIHKWNIIKLSPRQHFIAHLILYKAYGGLQKYAYFAMCNQIKNKNTKRHYKINSVIYEKLKLEMKKNNVNRGYAAYKDKEGNNVWTKTTDERVLNGELTSLTKNRKYKPRSEESKERTRQALIKARHNPDKLVNLWKLEIKITIKRYSKEYDIKINEGWSTKCTKEYSAWITSYNNSIGKSGIKGIGHRKEVKEKMSKDRKGRETSKEARLKISESVRLNDGRKYTYFVYSKKNDLFFDIDKRYYDINDHIKVSVRKPKLSKKIKNIITGEILIANPDLPKLPPNFLYADQFFKIFVYNSIDNSFHKIMKKDLNENLHIIKTTITDKIQIIDKDGIKRSINKIIYDMWMNH